MPDTIADNPFTQVYDSLWSLVTDHPDIDDIVKVGNRIDFSADKRQPHKNQIATADLPELVLVQGGLRGSLYHTSSSTRCTREYRWLISTGDFRINHFLNKVEWMLFVAHLGWTSTLTSLQYNGASFVKRCEILDAQTGASDPERNRNIQGWSSIWRIEVEMHFKTSDLKGELS